MTLFAVNSSALTRPGKLYREEQKWKSALGCATSAAPLPANRTDQCKSQSRTRHKWQLHPFSAYPENFRTVKLTCSNWMLMRQWCAARTCMRTCVAFVSASHFVKHGYGDETSILCLWRAWCILDFHEVRADRTSYAGRRWQFLAPLTLFYRLYMYMREKSERTSLINFTN